MFALFGHLLPDFSISSSAVGQTVRKQMASICTPNMNHDEQKYQVQIFSRDPLIVYIRNFVSRDDIAYLLDIRYEVYMIDYFCTNGAIN